MRSCYFFDTSALVRRYVPEVGSAWVKRLVEPTAQNTVFISDLTTIEVISAFVRRRREGSVLTADFERVRDDFLAHVKTQYLTIALRHNVLEQAHALVEKHPLLRTLDAIQLACALTAAQAYEPPIFVCADKRLLDAAVAESLLVENPLDHS